MKSKKILKFILIILLIFLFIFLIDLARKVYIINEYNEKGLEYYGSTNFRKKIYRTDGYYEILRNGDKIISTDADENGILTLYSEKGNCWMISNMKDSDDIMKKTAVKVDNLNTLNSFSIVSVPLNTNNLWETIKVAFSAKISTEYVHDIECYKFYFSNDFQMYIDKERSLIVKELNGSIQDLFIEYEFNNVKDEDIKLPDLTDYELKEANAQ